MDLTVLSLSIKVFEFEFEFFFFLFSSRPDITVMVDWAQNTTLLTYFGRKTPLASFLVEPVQVTTLFSTLCAKRRVKNRKEKE